MASLAVSSRGQFSSALSTRRRATVPLGSPRRCVVVRAAWGGALPPRAYGAPRPRGVGSSMGVHSMRHEERVTAEEELHNSRQVALLAMVPVALMSLKWAVSIGVPALVVPAALLAVPIAGSGLRDLLAEGLCMAWRWTSWIQNHQAPPHAADGSHHQRGVTRNPSSSRQRSPDRSVPQYTAQPVAMQPHHQHHAAPRPQLLPPGAVNMHAHPAQPHTPNHAHSHSHSHSHQHAAHDHHGSHATSWARHQASEPAASAGHGHVSHPLHNDPHAHPVHAPSHHMPATAHTLAHTASSPAPRHPHMPGMTHSPTARPAHMPVTVPHTLAAAVGHTDRESTLGVVAHAAARDTAGMDDDMDWPATGDAQGVWRHAPSLHVRSTSPAPLLTPGLATGLPPPASRRSV